MAGGYMGKILFIDLSDRQVREEGIDESLCRDYLGGYGFGIKYLYEMLKPGIDPLGPENIIGFISGPLTGTGALVGARFMVVGKSPLTKGLGEANCGGMFGTAMKRAGFDGVLIKGCADVPVYILIDEEKVEIKDASFLWGKDTYETEDTLKDIYGKKAEVLSIGPAGEMCSLISAIITNKGNAAARSGLAAVMGSKKIKALVVRGSKEIPINDKESFKKIRKKYLSELLKDEATIMLRDYGTPVFLDSAVESGDAPVKNWAGAGTVDFPNYEKIGMTACAEIFAKKKPCYSCPVSCHRAVNLKEKNGEERVVGIAEYETLVAFGPMCLNEDLESIIRCNDICNRYGLDTISTGGIVAFAVECFEKNILTLKETDGLELKWGNSQAILSLTEKIAKREGIGALLADGSKLAAEKIGGEAIEYAMQIGGQELAMHDHRLFPGLLTTYWTDPTPGRHTQGSETWIPPGLELPDYNDNEQAGRGEVHKLLADINHVVDGFGLCIFVFFSLDVNSMVEFFNAATGYNMDLKELLISGERISNLRHAFNLREGINFLEYHVPKRLLGIPPLTEGPLAGVAMDARVLIGDYLKAMDWDQKTLVPSRKKLEALCLTQVIEDLYT